MPVLQPSSAEQLAELLTAASQDRQTVTLLGNNSKHLAAGPLLESKFQISTSSLDKILSHERNDLTISVQAGMKLSSLQHFLREHDQMIALDPPFFQDGTLGGILATDYSGPLRRHFGAARDQVIGMTFATLDGRLVKAGGMVVKNVAGLDLAKLLIGSFGTLAAITSVNLRVHPRPKRLQTFLHSFRDVDGAIQMRNKILRSVLTPWAIELFSAPAATRVGHKGVLLAIRVAGSAAILQRYRSELACDEILENEEDESFWRLTSNYISDFLTRSPSGVVLRLITPLSDVASIFQFASGSYVSHAGSGITDAFFNSWQLTPPLWNLAKQKGWNATVAFAPYAVRQDRELWLRPSRTQASETFAIMERVKQMFDPAKLLNRSRLYGCF